MTPKLFTPLTIRGLTLPNRVVISPMAQYSADDGIANDWHLVQYGRFAVGGAGVVTVEATAVTREGRITNGDLGLWSADHVGPLARIAAFLKANGSVPSIQLAHSGRKGSSQRPWHGNGPLTAADIARGDEQWQPVAPSAVPLGEGWLTPAVLDEAGVLALRDAFVAAARRALEAGFEIAEIHAAHGYMLHQFLSPIANHRTDRWGGDQAGRMALPLAVARGIRDAWPADKPVFLRLSMVDGSEGGLSQEDQVAFARALKQVGVDMVVASSGGMAGSATNQRGPNRVYGFQVPFAERIRREAGIATMAVGLIVDGRQAERILQEERADLIAVGRQALEDPNWALHAKAALEVDTNHQTWPAQHGWWMAQRDRVLERLGPWVP
ncbi:MAG: NADH:flavin oxidoreductase / NADH oxidase [Acetobacteraceae bacterium SCN 69-10]|nr:NADH:flavin oxidoreductase/NADH oxidase [Rhodospirillales bacterium]ODU55093.1 MAG: NADH:flavin oxidoreductase / NADH oxidase [Acetobacteraceae bacterium SCN 69-10]OJY74336.1 MAG: NADH:flavin oxidoreductase / NADH oxidase [Rhodospirillales bacterium 70-18]